MTPLTILIFFLFNAGFYLFGLWIATKDMSDVADELNKFRDRATREFTAGDLYITKQELITFRRSACKLKCFDEQAGRVLDFIEQRLTATLR
jgi:hypothetical protein